jgi:PBP1b-binding outer membrane lipoprotein LpoB
MTMNLILDAKMKYYSSLIASALLLIACSNDKDGRVVLLPNNYIGKVIIIHDVKNGEKKKLKTAHPFFEYLQVVS